MSSKVLLIFAAVAAITLNLAVSKLWQAEPTTMVSYTKSRRNFGVRPRGKLQCAAGFLNSDLTCKATRRAARLTPAPKHVCSTKLAEVV